MNLDYFVVGPRLALRSRSPIGIVAPNRLDFTILDPEHGEAGWIETQLTEGFIGVRPHLREDMQDTTAEAIRLVGGVLRKLLPVEIRINTGRLRPKQCKELVASGFRRETDHDWYLPPAEPFQARSKVATLEELYADPYSVVWNFEPRQWQVLGPLLIELSCKPGAKLLDIGCGFGKNAVLLEGMGFEVYGVDVAESAVSRCRRWVRHPERFQMGAVDALPFDDESFDVVLDVGCIHCLPPGMIPAAVGEVARVIRSGGDLFSRAFMPRSDEWLGAQAYAVEAVGIHPESLMSILNQWFDVSLWIDAEMSQVHGKRR